MEGSVLYAIPPTSQFVDIMGPKNWLPQARITYVHPLISILEEFSYTLY